VTVDANSLFLNRFSALAICALMSAAVCETTGCFQRAAAVSPPSSNICASRRNWRTAEYRCLGLTGRASSRCFSAQPRVIEGAVGIARATMRGNPFRLVQRFLNKRRGVLAKRFRTHAARFPAACSDYPTRPFGRNASSVRTRNHSSDETARVERFRIMRLRLHFRAKGSFTSKPTPS
jgi:hypothetical protein